MGGNRGQYDGSEARNVDEGSFTRGVDALFSKIDSGLTAIGELANVTTSARGARGAVPAARRSGAGYPSSQAPQPGAIAPATWRSQEMVDAATGRPFHQVDDGAGNKLECNSRELAAHVAAVLNAHAAAHGVSQAVGRGAGTTRNGSGAGYSRSGATWGRGR